jgi:hypothetical protein
MGKGNGYPFNKPFGGDAILGKRFQEDAAGSATDIIHESIASSARRFSAIVADVRWFRVIWAGWEWSAAKSLRLNLQVFLKEKEYFK